MIEARGHKLSIEVPEQTGYIRADPVRFEQIISNLLTNAAKYTDPGGEIVVGTKLETDRVTITVRDNGIGISQEQLPRLFEMFSQVTTAIERSEGGLGIGLALVRGLVLLHGGTIEARSAGIGQGSEFIVTLPLSPEEQVRLNLTATSNSVNKNLTRKRILMVDDNRDNADLCSIILKKAGHEVRTAYSGREALEIADRFRPNVVMLDIGMPDMNGYEVARQIREMTWGKDIILMAITGWGQEEDKLKAFAAGFNHHVTKPYDAKILEQLLTQPG
jgi:CheY-like chemotaxis protein